MNDFPLFTFWHDSMHALLPFLSKFSTAHLPQLPTSEASVTVIKFCNFKNTKNSKDFHWLQWPHTDDTGGFPFFYIRRKNESLL